MEVITIPKEKLEQMKQEIAFLRNSTIYKRLLEFEENISNERKFTRDDLGF
ncbi:MAG: hypothetical protein KJ905_02435 [Nanoarchaeota archaeon]|nr:hypothetical protein [Nanoarchaeota archaeon]MBU1501609.1 hypothetical protein [Nanoarchaeota archaeon]MBU2459299.1 hypothetical protein [Nanoarchaeota archaeon]